MHSSSIKKYIAAYIGTRLSSPATQETEIRRIMVLGQLGEKSWGDPYLNGKKKTGCGDVHLHPSYFRKSVE
jgi:hypothetical protein